MEVHLSKIDRSNFETVIALELEEHQEKNLPSNLYSMAESALSPLFHPRAIVAAGDVVGFVMYEFGAPGAYD